jgi:hypothetical protein
LPVFALGSRAAGTVLLLGFGWSMTGGPAGSLTLAIGFITAMVWIAVVTSTYRAHTFTTRQHRSRSR